MRALMICLTLIGFAPLAMAQTAEDQARKTLIDQMDADATQEQRARKARSVAAISTMGIPVLDSLPVTMSKSQSLRRNRTEVADRALALMIVALKGETGDQALVNQVIAQYGAVGIFTARERAFLDNPNPSRRDRMQMTWRYEGVAVLLWATGFIDQLPPPDQIIDAGKLGRIFRKLGPDGLRRKARLRPQAKILDQADMAYRLNWAAVNARVSNQPDPRGLDSGITYERHYAFNWLIGYAGLSWDDMRTDT